MRSFIHNSEHPPTRTNLREHYRLPYETMVRSPCCVKEGLKKGPWTQEEDDKLIAFVTEHGHGNWRALPKKCGLMRCGKSCRLRWNNYLRPDIKRGLFTHSEEQKIIQLHALVGNKWAFIASQLPKRTDNEIKNYWNTVLKKRLDKLGLSSLISFGAPSTHRTLIPAGAERQRQDMSKGMQRQDNQKNKSSSNASKKPSCNNSPTVMSCTHLAQWESARLEAEARLSKESQSSKIHKLFSFAYMGHCFSSSTSTSSPDFSSFSNHTHTNHQSQLPHLSNHTQTNPHLSTCSIPTILPSSISNPGLTHHSTINPLSTASSLSLSAIVSMPSTCSASKILSTSPTMLSSRSLSSLASQGSIASALTLGPSGRLSWQTKELSFTTSPPIGHTSHSSLISQLLSQIGRDNGQEVSDLQALTKEGTGELRGQEQMNMEATSCIVDLNSTMESSKDLNSSTMENWQYDLIFDVENSCSDVVSTSWEGPIVSSPQREEFTHDSPSLISNTTKSGTLQSPHGTLDSEGLNLFHFDSLMSCEHYANQHSNLLMKELLWDTPATLSISSTRIVN